MKNNGLSAKELAFEDEALVSVISDYTGEAGVRDLNAVCLRSVAR